MHASVCIEGTTKHEERLRTGRLDLEGVVFVHVMAPSFTETLHICARLRMNYNACVLTCHSPPDFLQ